MLRSKSIIWATATVAIAACTYNEYNNTYNEVVAPDAGASVSQAGRAGAGQSGSAGTGGTSGAGQGGTAGSTGNLECTGCLQLSMPANPGRAIELELPGDENLSSSRITWRLRLRGFTGVARLSFYAASGSAEDEAQYIGATDLDGSSDWQELGGDLTDFPSFSPPVFTDGGAAGSGFDPGVPFDKANVERIGVVIVPQVASGVFTPLTLEVDSVTISDHSDLGSTFTADGAGVELVEHDGTTIEGATLTHVGS